MLHGPAFAGVDVEVPLAREHDGPFWIMLRSHCHRSPRILAAHFPVMGIVFSIKRLRVPGARGGPQGMA